jgi:hypothetical protein
MRPLASLHERPAREAGNVHPLLAVLLDELRSAAGFDAEPHHVESGHDASGSFQALGDATGSRAPVTLARGAFSTIGRDSVKAV